MTPEPGINEEGPCTYKDPTVVIRESIENLILDLDDTLVLSKSRIKWMQRVLTSHLIELISKFIKGQIEHGDSIESVDLKKEINGELCDLFWYLSAYHKPMNRKKK